MLNGHQLCLYVCVNFPHCNHKKEAVYYDEQKLSTIPQHSAVHDIECISANMTLPGSLSLMEMKAAPTVLKGPNLISFCSTETHSVSNLMIASKNSGYWQEKKGQK